MNFELDPGDVLLFRGEHLHSSELNITGETRYVLTARFTTSHPRFPEPEGRWRPWYDSRLVGTPLEPLSSWTSWWSLRFARYVLDRWNVRLLHPLRWIGTRSKTAQNTDGHVSEAPSGSTRPAAGAHGLFEDLVVDLSDLPIGAIRAVSPSVCVMRTEHDVCAFARYCTHEGADLQFGHYQDGRIRCAWHHVPFDPRSGEQPCQSLKPLKVFAATKVGSTLYKIHRAE